MARANVLIPSFNAGEFSPRMVSRVDLAQYRFAGETFENLLLLQQGGFMRRPGTKYINAVKTESLKTRLLSFVFSTVQAYMLEAGNSYLRFYKDRAQITVADTDAAITNGDFPAGITDWDDRSTGTGAIAHDATNSRLSLVGATTSIAWAEQDVTTTATGVEHVLRFTVYGVAGDFIELRIGTTTTGNELIDDFPLGVGEHSIAFTPSASPFYVQFRNAAIKTIGIDDVSLIDNSPVEVTAPYLTADLEKIKYAQTADIMYLVHPDYRPRRLLRLGDSSWSLEEVDFSDGPYLTTNVTATTLTPGATTGLGQALTASSEEGVNGGQGFLSTDIGRLVRIQHSTTWGYGVITAVASTVSATMDIKRDFGAATAQASWALGAWSDTTGWPRAITFYESRSVYAGTMEQPQTFWLSQSGDFQNMQPDSDAGAVEDDDAINRTVASQTVNAILWLLTADKLVAGTTSNEVLARSTLDDEPITPGNFIAKPKTTRSCADINAVAIDEAAIFAQRGKRKLLAFGRLEGDAYQAFDLTVYAEHVTRGNIAELVYQEEPHSIVWVLRADGVLSALTYRPEQQVVGWSRHVLGGTDVVVEGIATIPGSGTTEARDELWCIVKRTINSTTHRYIEVFERDYEDGDDSEDAFYIDSGLTYSGAATATITGLSHLEGETVKVLAEGAVHPDRTVSGGSITLDETYTKAQVGLAYTHKYKSLKMEGGGTIGSAITQTRRLGRLGLILDNTLGLKVGDDEARLKEIPFRAVGDPMDTAVPPFTGEKIIEDFASEWSEDPRIHIQGDKPVPLTVLGMAPHLEVSDNT